MILSFHPNIVAHKNILCAGRPPNDDDRKAVQKAEVIIIPQGCSEDLYRLCREHCDHVFPNYDARFDFPGKLGQSLLFKKTGVPFPPTYTFETLSFYYNRYGQDFLTYPIGFPCVFKTDWGGEGEGVFLLDTPEDLGQALKKAEAAERGGLKGFLFQEYIPSMGRSLRVAVIGDDLLSYWRVQEDPSKFLANLKDGAVIDHKADPELQEAGRTAVRDFCSKTGINLAGFDLLFSQHDKSGNPFFLEINYFFGRRGLGGSLKYYELVERAVMAWLGNLGLSL